MNMSETTVRRGLYGVFAGGLLGLRIGSDRDADARERRAGSVQCEWHGHHPSSVSVSMSTYLQTHPQTNQALTDIAKQSPTRPTRPTGPISRTTRRSPTS